MKDHKKETKLLNIYSLEGHPDKVIEYIAGQCEGLIDPVIETDYEYGYYHGEDRHFKIFVHHWVPMTEKEIAKRDKDDAKTLENDKKRKEKVKKDELAMYERLHKKYGNK